ncbi:hypothetical protein P9D51_21455 [Bacillus sonorensis]|uniref:hypothetical protein n=1 Tax=Bacillus sonorensis TaxID=119858 RepID=UPI002DBE3835|nr:hypothetical protein [Bacillus sonorensis]MEC1353440.1 hypothetical protein [Bacillus sonorensis]MEC1428623.1 hypothetical protein [Bacillus sonorensis]
MKLATTKLLKKLSEYHFFNWEDDEQNEFNLIIGMPDNKLKKKDFYSSFGFESVENPHSEIYINAREWVELEDQFFMWVAPYLTNFKNTIVTPFLNADWEGEIDLEDIDDQDQELSIAYKDYKKFLISKGLYSMEPTLLETCRGYEIENINEYSIIGKMAARSNQYLFFSDNNKVFMFTDALTLKIYYKDKDVMEKEKDLINKILNPKFL